MEGSATFTIEVSSMTTNWAETEPEGDRAAAASEKVGQRTCGVARLELGAGSPWSGSAWWSWWPAWSWSGVAVGDAVVGV